MDTVAAKKELRQRMISTLRAATGAQCSHYSALLRAQLAPYLPVDGGCVAIYAPLPHEVDLLPLVEERPGLRFVFPLCLPGHALEFHHVTKPGTELVPGKHGILAPRLDLPVVEPQDIDLLVVPGVAFTAEGKRLGYGGGYYDRFIPRCPRARILALAFPWQIVPYLPTEEHDLRIQVIHH